jgi:uncharacterized lipoprotein YbaY/heat shock protein HslJ
MSLRGIAGLVVLLATALGAAAGDGQVTGVATYRERVALPPGAVFEAVLEDVSRTDTVALELGRATTSDPGSTPISFAIDYDPAAINPGHTYAVRARVTAGGRLHLTSDGVHPVITRGAPTHVGIGMVMVSAPQTRGIAQAASVLPAAGDGTTTGGQGRPPLRGLVTYMGDAAQFTDCHNGKSYPIAMEADYQALEHAYLAAGQEQGAPLMASFEGRIVERPRRDGGGTGPAVLVERFVGVWPGEECTPATEASLTDTYWKIVRLGELELLSGDDRREPHLILRPSDARFVATAGCNQLVGGFELSGDQLRFGEAAATLMACPPPLDAWEQQLARTLSTTAVWRIDGQTLELYDADGAAIATFRAADLP